MTRETFKLNPVTDGLREVIIQYDSEHTQLKIASRTKRRMVINVEEVRTGMDSSPRPVLYGPSDKDSLEPERNLPRPLSTLDVTGIGRPHGSERRTDSPE